VTFLLAEVVVAQVFAIVTAAVVGRQDHGVIRQGDIWHEVFAADRPPDREVQAMVLTAKCRFPDRRQPEMVLLRWSGVNKPVFEAGAEDAGVRAG
jgi:hypothetical protein